MPRNDLIQVRRGTTAQWNTADPVLAAGEPGAGIVGTAVVFKLGDGISDWDELPPVNQDEWLAAIAAQRGAADGLASLDSDGKIPAGQIPDLALSQFLGDVASQAAMLALVGQPGDWCIRTDLDPDQAFILVGADPAVLGSWRNITTPGAVLSVNGRVGAVTDLAEQVDLQAEADTRALADTAITTRLTEGTLVPVSIKTVDYAAAAGQYIPVDTTAGVVTISLPVNPADGAVVAVRRSIGAVNNAVVSCSGGDAFQLVGGSTTTNLTAVGHANVFRYDSTLHVWYADPTYGSAALLALIYGAAAPVFTNTPVAPAFSVTGLTGSVTPVRWVGGTATGAPTTGAHLVGDYVVAADGVIWVCTVAGTPGTWVDASSSGKELAYVESATVQTGITTITDITGMTIPDFTVGARPVYIEAETGFTYPVTAIASVVLQIHTAANVLVIPTATKTVGLNSTTNTGAMVRVKARLTTPGLYSGLKLRIARGVGTGTITNGFDASTPTTCSVTSR